jgi:hypothetical protein
MQKFVYCFNFFVKHLLCRITRSFPAIIVVFAYGANLSGQTLTQNLSGQVSFISSQNIYVKFKSTEGISAGDTLFTASNGNLVPVLTINNLSSSSCVCTGISEQVLHVSDLVIAKARIKTEQKREAQVTPAQKEIPTENPALDKKDKQATTGNLSQKIKGSLSAFSYSDFSNTTASNSQRFRYTFSLDAKNISNSKFSAETYISFKHKLGDWSEVKSNLFNALKIYSLAVKYDLNKTTQISLGRKINYRISSIGAMDGLQVEKTMNKFALGALVGSRPDYANYGFDPSLFQYGAYVAHNTKSADNYTESSLAFMQQTNKGNIDRRFIYLQHSNSLVKNVFFFGTFEIDLYKLNNGKPQSTFNPTGMFLSLRYKMTKNLTLSGSYDARKNVMYYETFKSSIDSAFEKELRQGYRLQGNYRISKNIMFGLQSGYRFMKSDPHPSKNIYSYLTYSQIPGINASLTLSATYLESNYMNGKILGASMNRDFFQGKFSTGIGYRYIDYRLPENLLTIKQNISEMNISWQFAKTMSFSANYEGTFEANSTYNRFYLQIRKRF